MDRGRITEVLLYNIFSKGGNMLARFIGNTYFFHISRSDGYFISLIYLYCLISLSVYRIGDTCSSFEPYYEKTFLQMQ